jgi:hypothetical protein
MLWKRYHTFEAWRMRTIYSRAQSYALSRSSILRKTWIVQLFHFVKSLVFRLCIFSQQRCLKCMHSISDTVHYIATNVRPTCVVYATAIYKFMNSKSGRIVGNMAPHLIRQSSAQSHLWELQTAQVSTYILASHHYGQFWSQVRSKGTCGEQSGPEAGFLWVLRLTLKSHSTNFSITSNRPVIDAM